MRGENGGGGNAVIPGREELNPPLIIALNGAKLIYNLAKLNVTLPTMWYGAKIPGSRIVLIPSFTSRLLKNSNVLLAILLYNTIKYIARFILRFR